MFGIVSKVSTALGNLVSGVQWIDICHINHSLQRQIHHHHQHHHIDHHHHDIQDNQHDYIQEAQLPPKECIGKAAVGDCRNNSGFNDALEIE